jgi:predicted nucleic acid-binding protein
MTGGDDATGKRVFFDSNVVLYLVAGDDRKADRAESLLAAGGSVSVQVLNECASVARSKFNLSWTEVREILQAVRSVCTVHPITIEAHLRGIAIAERFGFRVYDSMIVAAALEARCRTLFSEDLQHGQRIDGLTIRNPFLNL